MILSLLAISFTTKSYAVGASVSFSAVSASSIPTLSTTMLLVLSLLLLVVAFRVSKQKNNAAGKIFVTLLGVSAIVTMGHSVKLISDTNAGGVPVDITPSSPLFTIEAGETIDFVTPEDLAVSLSIKVDADSQCFFTALGDACVPANLIPPGVVIDLAPDEDSERPLSLPFTGILNTIIPADAACLIMCIDPNAEDEVDVDQLMRPAAKRARRR